MSEIKSIQTIHFACACRQVIGSFKAHDRDLPLPLCLCHCTTCRHQSGLLCNSYATLPQGAEFEVNGPVEFYKASETAFRFFCSNCGANVYFDYTNTEERSICTGVLEKAEGVITLTEHIFVADSKDGGMSDWIPDVEAWEGFSKVSKKLVDADWETGSKASGKEARELQAYCCCKGVRFKITRPDASSANLTAPRGDIVGPSTATDQDGSKDSDEPWWLRENGTKYLGGTCACNECRLASGFDVQAWAFVPKASISQLNGKPLDFSAGTLKRYDSSEGVYREFCSKCGATVFWHSDSRPELIDVSVGLLDAVEGARAESWLGWKTERVSFQEEAQNKDLVSKLSAGLRRWGQARVHSSAEKHDLGNQQIESDSKEEQKTGVSD